MLSVGCWAFSAVGAFAASEPALLTQARTALAESLPQIAVEKLRRVLASKDLAPDVRGEANRLLAQAQLAAGQPELALASIGNPEDAAGRLLKGHILARAGRWDEALEIYEPLSKEADAPLAAKLGTVEAYYATGDVEKAIGLLEPLVRSSATPVSVQLRLVALLCDSRQGAQARAVLAKIQVTDPADRLWAQYIEGRLLLLEKQPSAALATFRAVLAAESHLSENLLAAASMGVGEARLELNGPDAADKELETFIWRYPDNPWIEVAFRRLDAVYAQEKNAPESELQKWALKPQQRRAALARFYVAQLQMRAHKWDKAIASLDAFVHSYPTHRFLVFAEIMRADALAEKGQLDVAVRALEAASRVAATDEQRAEIELRTGLVQYRQREFLLAAGSLSRAAERSSRAAEVAIYDTALAWLGQENYARFREEYQKLTTRGAPPELRGNLLLEEGLVRAREKDPAAGDALRRFLNEFPRHGRADEARLALAELAYANGHVEDASKFLQVANAKPQGAEIDDQADYLAIFLADAKPSAEDKPRDDSEVIRLAVEFLRARPKSSLVPEVRMKLGEVYFRQPDYANAETQFATLAHDTPTSPFAETALFLAGQAAARSINTGAIDRALGYFDEVVKRSGPLKLRAREQQALIQARLGKEQEAVAIYDLILESKSPAPDAELRYAALVGKGDTLVAMGTKEPKQLEAAIAVFDQLAAIPEAGPSWRHQAIYKKARALDQLGRKTEAAAAFNEVLDRGIAGPGREFFWFYKAGFEAGRRFEQQPDWNSAIATYEKIARIEGPRAAEAASRARQLRVDHFVWD